MVDDWLPAWCPSESQCQPAFCRSKRNELWPSLIEKAWAKVHGSYDLIVSGQPVNAITHLIGIPTFHSSLNQDKSKDVKVDTEEIWGEMIEATSR